MNDAAETITLDQLERCFSGAIPAVMATADADGVPNVTYVSRAHRVDDERIALSNQFMSKTARNIAANPYACLLLIDPVTHDEYRVEIVYERTERRGHVFERLRHDIDLIASVHGMQDVFRLRAADIFRVTEIAGIAPHPSGDDEPDSAPAADLAAVAEVTARIGRCADLDTLVDTTLAALDHRLGFHHVHLMLLDEEGRRLYTIGSRGFDGESIGAEVAVGEGMIGTVAERCQAMRLGNLRQMTKYSASVRRQFQDDGVHAGREVAMPGLEMAESRMAVPAMARGELVGVLAVDSYERVAFTTADEQALAIVAGALASAIEHVRAVDDEDEVVETSAPPATPVAAQRTATVRFFPVDGSTFLDNDYLIKGVAGRILWSLLRQHAADGRVDFTNKELRLDRSLEMPGFKDNLESRLILLKRRLDEREAPVRLERTGRGRFRLHTETSFRLEAEPA